MASVDQITDEIHMLVHVCRLIAGKANDADMADELVELAESLDRKVDRLREAIARVIN